MTRLFLLALSFVAFAAQAQVAHQALHRAASDAPAVPP